jgi:hypothetical protein
MGGDSFMLLHRFDDPCKPNIFILSFQNKLSITAKCTWGACRSLPSTNIKMGRVVVSTSTLLFSAVCTDVISKGEAYWA